MTPAVKITVTLDGGAEVILEIQPRDDRKPFEGRDRTVVLGLLDALEHALVPLEA